MVRKQGFLVYDEANQRYFIDYQQSLSTAANELLLELLLAAQPYMRGRLLDVGCGKRPYALIYERHVELSIGTEVQFSLHGTAAADLIGYAEELPFADASFDTISLYRSVRAYQASLSGANRAGPTLETGRTPDPVNSLYLSNPRGTP